MNWDAVAAVGEILGALAVFITLLYLARQVRQSNRQNLLSSFQHTYDSINQFLESTLMSEQVADVVVRGRESYEALPEADRLQFDHFHLVILNIVESHLFQVERTAGALEQEYREWAVENMGAVVKAYFSIPWTRTCWSQAEAFFEPKIREFVRARLGPGGDGPTAPERPETV